MGVCPDCGGNYVAFEAGCENCKECGYSACAVG